MLWSAEENRRLQELLPHQSIRRIAAELGRTMRSVHGAVQRLKLNRPRVDGWETEEIEFVQARWPHASASVIGARIGRSRSAVIGKVNRLRRAGVTLERQPERIKRIIPATPQRKLNQTNRKPKAKPPKMIQCPCQIVELEPVNCKWPYGDPRQDGFYFCGAVKFNGGPYCPVHHRQAHHTEPYRHARSRVPAEPVHGPATA